MLQISFFLSVRLLAEEWNGSSPVKIPLDRSGGVRWRAWACVICVAVGALLAGRAGIAAESTKPLPVESFFKRAAVEDASLSPDGKFLAFLVGSEKAFNVAVLEIATGEARQLTNFDHYDAYDIHWATNTRLIFDIADQHYRLGGLLAVDRDGKHLRELYSPAKDFRFRVAEVMDWRADKDGWILMRTRGRDTVGKVWDVSKMNVRDGSLRLLEQNRGQTIRWLADMEGRVRIAIDQDGAVRHRLADDRKWENLQTFETTDPFDPIGMEADGQTLLVKAYRGKPTLGLHRYSVVKRDFVETLVEQSQFDIEGVYWPGNVGRVVGGFYEADVPRAVWFDAAAAARQEKINQLRPGAFNRVLGQSDDAKRVLVYSYGDRLPGAYFLFDVEAGTLRMLTASYPWLQEGNFGAMRPFTLQARDGMKLRGYLTLPPGSDGKNLPLVVQPHGGPWARDKWGFDAEVQFLASRGYAVLQVNFRGSTGYGRAFLSAGFGQWGLTMQDDVTDAVRWAIEQGHADPKRIAIFGASYGGYAAMAGLAFTPELYRCGISYVGVTDVATLIKSRPREWWLSEAIDKMVTGDPDKDRARLDAASPLVNADKIRAPVLLAYGAKDERVNISQGKGLAAKLKSQGSSVELIVKEEEGHGFRELKNQVEFYTRVEAFLAKHLAPDPATTR